MLSFVIDYGNQIQIICDEKGAGTLIDAVERIRHTGGHVHLRSPGGGGRELDDKTPWGEDAVAQVIITCHGDNE
jgi:hypothetical protein